MSILACSVCQVCQVYWHTPLVLALEGQRQMNLREFEISLIYVVSSRPTWGYTAEPCLRKQTEQKMRWRTAEQGAEDLHLEPQARSREGKPEMVWFFKVSKLLSSGIIPPELPPDSTTKFRCWGLRISPSNHTPVKSASILCCSQIDQNPVIVAGKTHLSSAVLFSWRWVCCIAVGLFLRTLFWSSEKEVTAYSF